jgi:toxin FitB
MWLADSNILILAASRLDHPLQAWLEEQVPAISPITRIEVLGFHKFKPGEKALIQALIDPLDELGIGPATVNLAIGLRQQRKMSLADALIAATALEHNLTLATRNLDDFSWVPGLRLDGLVGIQ